MRNIVELESFLGPDDVISIATPERDGVFAQASLVPPANDLFGGAFDPTHAGWVAPVSDTWTHQLPANAEPGTYRVTVKARRVYLGEDVPASRTVEIQVGTTQRTEATLTTGKCSTCHQQGGELGKVLHATDEPRHLHHLPRPARLRAGGPRRGAHALRPLARPLRRAPGEVLLLPPVAGEHPAHQQGRLPLVPQELPRVPRGEVRAHRAACTWAAGASPSSSAPVAATKPTRAAASSAAARTPGGPPWPIVKMQTARTTQSDPIAAAEDLVRQLQGAPPPSSSPSSPRGSATSSRSTAPCASGSPRARAWWAPPPAASWTTRASTRAASCWARSRVTSRWAWAWAPA